jgi:hypothetical protein
MTTHITKTWFDGEKVLTQEIPESEVYKQEPVAWYDKHGMVTHDPFEGIRPLYAAPRQWIGLTNQERNYLWREFIGWGDPSHDDENLMKAIEDKLKEKNT